MLLDTTSKTIQVLLTDSVETNQLPIVAWYADHTTTTLTPGCSDSATNNTTAVTAVAAPGASTQRQVKMLSVFNADTKAATVIVRLNNNGTMRNLAQRTLLPGQSLSYVDGAGWSFGNDAPTTLQSLTDTVITAPDDGHVLVYSSSEPVGWVNVPVSVDVQFLKVGSATVVGLQGRPVSDAGPNGGDVLTWDGDNLTWKPAAPGGGGGGVEWLYDLKDVDVPKPPGEPDDGDLLQYDENANAWEDRSLAEAGIEPALGNPESDGYILSSTTSGVRSWVAPGGGGDPGEGHIVLFPYNASGTTGTWTHQPADYGQYQSYTYRNSPAQSESVSWKAYLAAGTYTARLIGKSDSDFGIGHLFIDATDVGGFDQYSSGAASNVVLDITNITVSQSGLKTIKVSVDTKNESSTGYRLFITMLALWRTA